MDRKERNRAIAYKIASEAFFKANLFTAYYDKDFTMDIPTAPPGMPNHYTTWEAECCFTWLNRTVRKWDVSLSEFYGSENPDLFWAIGDCDADVHWGDHDGHFASMFALKIILSEEGKVRYLSWRSDPSEMLVAAGRERPPFDVEKALTQEEVKNYKWFHSLVNLKQESIPYPLGNHPEEIKERIQIILDQHSCGVDRERYRKLPRNEKAFKGNGCMVPKQQTEAAIKHKDEIVGGINAVFAWVKQSSPWMYRDPRNIVYATDDPHVYFAEMNCHGPGCWCGIEGKTGHYHQDYLVYIRVDDQGYLTSWYEILNNVNILNASNVNMGSFPYYY